MSRCDCAGAPLYRCPKCGAKGIAEGKRPDMSTETPITDALINRAHGFAEIHDLARKLERDRAALIAALTGAAELLAGCMDDAQDWRPEEVIIMDMVRATLAAVQS